VLRREIDDKPGIAAALSNLGLLAASRGDYGTARTFHWESLALAQKLGRTISVAISLINLGFVAHHQQQYGEARALYAQSLTLFEELGDKINSLACLAGLASTLVLAPERADDPVRGAQLLGAVAALSATLHAPLPPYWRPLYDPAVAAVQATLGDTAFRQAWAAGQTMTLEQALAAAIPAPAPA
jgi:tetratricopeptide (TPR) repeat protein